MAGDVVNVVFPKLGVVRRFVLRTEGSRAEYGCPWAYNVRLEDSLTNRLRGGSFVGATPEARPCPTVYRDRTLTFSENAITASRVGDAVDTDMSSDVSDMMRPAMFQFSEADQIAPDVVALVPHKDHHLLCFSATETWVQQGDPLNGPRRRVSDQVGIVGKNAWCIAHDAVYFLSARGLYVVGADGSGLKPLSEDYIPEDLLALAGNDILLDYDHATRGVSIHLPTAPSWFYDAERGGFWPFNTGVAQSHVLLGPFRLSQDDYYGRILDIHGNMATGSADVTWAIVPGKTAEEAAANGKLAIEAAVAANSFAAYIHRTGTWSAGRSHRSYPRTRAIWCCIWISATGTWAYEAVTLKRIESGKWR